MSDYRKIITTENGRFKLEIWDTSKGFHQGDKRWNVCVSIPFGDTRIWHELERQSGQWNSPDRADRDGQAALKHWSETYTGEGVES